MLIIGLAPVARATTTASTPARPGAYGSGNFGSWITDRYGLPAYDYTTDEATAARAAQPELAGSTDAWSQVGNDHIVANAYNHGYVQLWSADTSYQWINKYDASSDHFAGGFGYITTGGHVTSTLYADRPAGAATTRHFGVGYYATSLQTSGLQEASTVYAPFGDDPVLLHDVTVTNAGNHAVDGSYVEYWDVNPQLQAVGNVARGYTAPTYDPATRTLAVTETPYGTDQQPLTIFASALATPVSSYDADTRAFFGTGTRARPRAVASGHLTDALAPADVSGQTGRAMFAFQTPLHLGPGQSVTLHYAYGYGHPAQIAAMESKYAAAGSRQLQASEQDWRAWLPQTRFGAQYAWLSRELEWDAYMVRSDATDDGMCGYHILSQGGYYQYYFGINAAYRDPLQIMLPMIWSDPQLARQVIEYSAHEQEPAVGAVPYAVASGCQRFDLGTSDDLDLWLLWGTAEYVLATRDFSFLQRQVPYFGGAGTGTVLQHLQVAFTHQEDVIGRGPHGEYVTGATGDWSDFSTEFLQMTESDLVTAQAAYVYPELAGVVARAGDAAFAAELRAAAARDLAVVKGQLVTSANGTWFARGYSGPAQLGRGAMFEEPQPWGLLEGAANRSAEAAIVASYRRYLVGVGAPAFEHGPSRIGAAMTPDASDPGVTQKSQPALNNSSGWPGGSWYDLNGWMVWALADLDGVVPGAAADAWNEFLRNTLAAHANAYPDSWDGIISVDDECAAFYSPTPSICGIGLTTAYDTQIPNQPAYSLFDLVKLIGVAATPGGYQVTPHMPMSTFDVRLRGLAVAARPGYLGGSITPVQGGTVDMAVALPPGVPPAQMVTTVDGHAVAHSYVGGLVHFDMSTVAGRAAAWTVS